MTLFVSTSFLWISKLSRTTVYSYNQICVCVCVVVEIFCVVGTGPPSTLFITELYTSPEKVFNNRGIALIT